MTHCGPWAQDQHIEESPRKAADCLPCIADRPVSSLWLDLPSHLFPLEAKKQGHVYDSTGHEDILKIPCLEPPH